MLAERRCTRRVGSEPSGNGVFLCFRENALEDKVSLHWKSENNTISEVNGTKVFSYGKNMKAVTLVFTWTFVTVLLECIDQV